MCSANKAVDEAEMPFCYDRMMDSPPSEPVKATLHYTSFNRYLSYEFSPLKFAGCNLSPGFFLKGMVTN
jgi:hypothetical protein